MHPDLLRYHDVVVHSHSVVLLIAFIVAGFMRRAESRRLGYVAQPGYGWVSVGALVGAVLGSKLGMFLYVDHAAWQSIVLDTLRLETSGKTVIGALIGGYAGVELAKKCVGIRASTGDAFAVAVPLALGIGRIACLLAGCCYGTTASYPWSVYIAGANRHPVQLYEAVLDIGLAGVVFATRRAPRRAGDLFKLCLIGYAAIRVLLDPWRGDARVFIGAVSAVQLVCLCAIAALSFAMLRQKSTVDAFS